ncbi:MAG: TonB-dependent receptor, partial [Tannerellaceae bacterium]|nr:TonB-dependent receptor [Tannerellaceae bacterium]
ETDGYKWGYDNDFHRAGLWQGDNGIPNLTWETVAKTNIGLELGLWNAVELQVDLFQEKRRDIFMSRESIPGSSGFVKTPWANYGKVDNKGIELSLMANKQLNKNLGISFRGSFTYVSNKIVEKDEPATIIGTNRARTGHAVGQLYGLIAEGLFTEDDFIDGKLKPGLPEQKFTEQLRPGDIRYRDINGDGVIDDLDQCPIGGTEDPQIVYGFGTNMRYKNIDFGFFFQGNGKTYRILGGGEGYFLPGSGNGAMGNIYSNVDDRWTVENPSQDVFWPRLTAGDNVNNKYVSTWWLRNMSMLRLKNVEVGYNFPSVWMKKIGIQSARLFASGNNLMTFSGFKMWDPELGSNNGFRYPIMKSVSFGLDINF